MDPQKEKALKEKLNELKKVITSQAAANWNLLQDILELVETQQPKPVPKST